MLGSLLRRVLRRAMSMMVICIYHSHRAACTCPPWEEFCPPARPSCAPTIPSSSRSCCCPPGVLPSILMVMFCGGAAAATFLVCYICLYIPSMRMSIWIVVAERPDGPFCSTCSASMDRCRIVVSARAGRAALDLAQRVSGVKSS